MEYKRHPSEDIDTYRLRLSKNKDLYDITWQEIAELYFEESGEKKSPDYFRKTWRYYNEGYEAALKENPSNSEVVDEMEEKRIALQKERYKLQAVKTEYNKFNREDARSELFYEEYLKALQNRKIINVPSFRIQPNTSKKDVILPLADIHYGKKVIVRGFEDEIINEYNVEIFERRMWTLLQDVVSKLEKENLRHINIINLSDSLDGILRMSQLQALQLGVIDSVIGFSDFMATWLNQLSNYATIDYYSCQGNHTEIRPLGSKKGDFPHENAERLITWHLQSMLKDNQNIKIHKNKALNYFDVVGTKVLAVHGQDEKNLESSIKDYIVSYNKPVDLLLTGHLHHTHEKTVGMNGLTDIKFIQTPSICGIDEFSIKLKKTANAGSTLMVFEEGLGRTTTYDIKLR